MSAQQEAQSAIRIRHLNDAFRKSFVGGVVLCTAGVEALPLAVRSRLLTEIRAFDRFTDANDPHHEHDFGLIEGPDEPIIFKIDYYDREMAMHSPDPADPAVTTRVLTVMLASEY